MLHIWAFLDRYDRDVLHWRNFEETREKAFAMVKTTARLHDVQLLLFDGRIYRYDPGQGKYIRVEWDDIDWEVDCDVVL